MAVIYRLGVLMHFSVSSLARVLALGLLGAAASAHADCPNDDSGLTLPAGFCATVFADDIGHARQLVVSPAGVVYVNTWSGRYYANSPPPPGGFLVALQDIHGTGKADVNRRFGETLQTVSYTHLAGISGRISHSVAIPSIRSSSRRARRAPSR